MIWWHCGRYRSKPGHSHFSWSGCSDRNSINRLCRFSTVKLGRFIRCLSNQTSIDIDFILQSATGRTSFLLLNRDSVQIPLGHVLWLWRERIIKRYCMIINIERDGVWSLNYLQWPWLYSEVLFSTSGLHGQCITAQARRQWRAEVSTEAGHLRQNTRIQD